MFLNVKKKDYNNWLFLLKNNNSSNVKFFIFFHTKYVKSYNWKEFSLLCFNNKLHKLSKFYLLNLDKNFYNKLKGNSIFYGLLNLNNIANIVKYFNFLFILSYNKFIDSFLLYINKNIISNMNLNYLNNLLLQNLSFIYLFQLNILNNLFIYLFKIFKFKIKI